MKYKKRVNTAHHRGMRPRAISSPIYWITFCANSPWRVRAVAKTLTLFIMCRTQQLRDHMEKLAACTRCPTMAGPVVTGAVVVSPVVLIGQAPGKREGPAGKPFAWTAGKVLFDWFRRIGIEETLFRKRIYIAAVCRCFPGTRPRGGDRVPSPQEIANCSPWLEAELQLLEPELVIPVGKLAISRLTEVKRLADVIGVSHHVTAHSLSFDVIPLPHPSGASTWHRMHRAKTCCRRRCA